MKKIYIPLIAAVLLGLCGAGYLAARQSVASAQSAEPVRTAVIERRTLLGTVSATGHLDGRLAASAAFLTSGRIVAVDVRPGDHVTAGQVLARTDTAAPALDVADAQARLAQSRAALDGLSVPAAPYDIAAAEASLAAAQAELAERSAAPDAATIEIARLNVERARIQLWQAQLNAPDPALGGYLPDYEFEVGRLSTESAEADIAQAEADYRQALTGPSPAQVAAARAQIDQAQAALDRLKSGPDRYDVGLAEAQVASAELALTGAEQRLAEAVLRAPMDGIVTAVDVQAGELATPGAPAITILDDGAFHLDVAVDELDVPRLQPGQSVTVTVDALKGLALPAAVTEIARSAANTGGAITYAVRVDLARADPRLRAGMTVTALVVTERIPDALVVPNWALRFDRATGQAFVSVRRDAAIVEVPVTLGLRAETHSQVLAGLVEGDVVVLQGEVK